MKQIFWTISAILSLAGCGGGGDSSNISVDDGSYIAGAVEMEPGETYQVYPGDKIIKNSDTAVVTISHVDGTNEADVVLKEGNATILYR